jgi:hypothetical protein
VAGLGNIIDVMNRDVMNRVKRVDAREIGWYAVMCVLLWIDDLTGPLASAANIEPAREEIVDRRVDEPCICPIEKALHQP